MSSLPIATVISITECPVADAVPLEVYFQNPRASTLYISGWQSEKKVTGWDVCKIFGRYGKIIFININSTEGLASIVYDKPMSALKAAKEQHRKAKIDTETLTVETVKPIYPGPGELYVDGWGTSSNIAKKSLLKIFGSIGSVSRIFLGENKDFAIISYHEGTNAMKAVEKYNNIATFGGKKIRVILREPIMNRLCPQDHTMYSCCSRDKLRCSGCYLKKKFHVCCRQCGVHFCSKCADSGKTSSELIRIGEILRRRLTE